MAEHNRFMENTSPLQYLSKKLENFKGAVKEIFIPELLDGAESNVIVVDGSQFYGIYVYPNFDWVCGDLAELVDVVRRFVLAFEKIGARLVFFFVDGHIDEGQKGLGSKEWMSKHSQYAQYAVKFYDTLKQTRHSVNAMRELKKQREYYHSPFHAQSVVLHVLKHMLKCEIHFVDSGFRNDSVAFYARNNKCLAVLVEDKMYFFYKNLPNYLSLKNLNLQKMKTKLYNLAFLPSYFKISEQHLYPCVIQYIAEKYSDNMIAHLNRRLDKYKNNEYGWNGKFFCLNVQYSNDDSIGSDDCDEKGKKVEKENSGKDGKEEKEEEEKHKEQAKKQIEKKDNTEKKKEEDERKNEGCQNEEGDEDSDDSCDSGDSGDSGDSDILCHLIVKGIPLHIEYIRYNKGYIHHEIYGPRGKWRTIQLRAKELYTDGLMSRRIKRLIEAEDFYNDSILEDFDELPPSCYIYEPLRKKMYGILFHEAPRKDFDGVVEEYCILNTGCMRIDVQVDPLKPDIKNMHLGLLKLWNLNDVSVEVMTAKWQLFSSCISLRLCHKFQNLPPTLVVPTAVLFYLYQKVPRMFKKCEKFMEPWEVDVFIVHFLMLPKMSPDYLSKITISNYNSRALKLIAMFVYGCLNMHLLVEVCGSFINKKDVCLLHYFNGKLFHSLYMKAEWRRKDIERQLSDEESLTMFHKIKEIVSRV